MSLLLLFNYKPAAPPPPPPIPIGGTGGLGGGYYRVDPPYRRRRKRKPLPGEVIRPSDDEFDEIALLLGFEGAEMPSLDDGDDEDDLFLLLGGRIEPNDD